jgi:hypothetical protein
MGMGRPFVARFAGPSASTLSRSVAATVGVLLPVTAFGWFVVVAPAVVSLAVAVGAAMAWCAWLEKHPNAVTGEDMSASMDIGDRLLLVFAGFIAVVCGLSGLALLVIASAAAFE